MNKAKRKNILIDLSDLKHPNCGFGQIAIKLLKTICKLTNRRAAFFLFAAQLLPKNP